MAAKMGAEMGARIDCNVPNDQLGDDEWNVINHRMLPGQFSKSGFVAQTGWFFRRPEDARQIIKDDLEYLKSHTITTQNLANVLRTVVTTYKQVCRQFGIHPDLNRHPIPVNTRFLVMYTSYMGAQQCPFQNKDLDPEYHGHDYGDSDVEVICTKGGVKKTLKFGTLLMHLIEKHQFFESPRVEYRLSPADIIEFFGLQSQEPEKILGDPLDETDMDILRLFVKCLKLIDFEIDQRIYLGAFNLSEVAGDAGDATVESGGK